MNALKAKDSPAQRQRSPPLVAALADADERAGGGVMSAAPPPPAVTTEDREPTVAVLRDRGVPNKMGTVRLGNSARPFPIIASSARHDTTVASGRDAGSDVDGRILRSRAAGIASHTAGPITQRHVSLERHPNSPFGRKIELTQKLILAPEEDERERFQVRKSIVKSLPHKRKLQGDLSSKQRPERSGSASLSQRQTPRTGDSFPHATEPKERAAGTNFTKEKSSSREDRTSRVVRESLARVEEARHKAVQRPPRIVTNSDHFHDMSASRQIMVSSEAPALDAYAHLPKRADLQVSHDRVNCITIGNSTDLQLLTQRSEEEDNATRAASKAFHTTFHEHSTLGYSTTSQSHYPKNTSTPINHFHASSEILSNNKTPWREVDESIEHIYEDPSTDFVQLKLLHRSSETSKRQKLLERERVLAAASELREHEQREREQFDALQRKKMHVEQMSEAIRLRNKKRFLKSEPNYELIDKSTGAAAVKRPDDQLDKPKRKPPVPRQRGRRKEQSQTRNDRLKGMTEAITLQMARRSASLRTAAPEVRRRAKKEKPTNQGPWSVSSSILLGDSSEFAPKDSVRQSIGEESHEGHEVGILNPSSGSSQETAAESISTPKHNIKEEGHAHPPKRSRSNRKPNRPVRGEEPEPNPVEIKEKTERRELAREYMELQKQSRKLHNVKEKQRRELETQRRRLQLEKLEQERVESLRRSKKLSFKRSRNAFGSEKDHHSPQREFPRRRVAQEKKFGVPMSEDSDADDTEVRELFTDDEGHRFIASDQENQRNNRNQMHDRATDLHNFGGQRSGYDASFLIGYSSADDKHSSMTSYAQSAPTEVDVRLHRLLELEQKTQRLSMLVNGMKIYKGAPPSTASVHVQMREEEEEPSDNEDSLQASIVKGGADLHDDREDLFENVPERSGKYEEEAASDDCEHDEERSEDEASMLKRYVEAEEALSSDSGDDQRAVNGETSGREDEDENEEHRIVNTRFRMNAHDEEVRLPTSASIVVDSATAQISSVDTPEFDLRSIGIHNIKVGWPMEHDSDDGGDADSDGGEVSPRHSSSASSASSRSELQYDQAQVLLSSSHRSLGSDRSNRSTDQFETSIHAYMKQRRLRDQAALSSEDAAERNASNHSSLHDQRDEIAPMHAVPTPPVSKATEPNEALLRMIREADDSLSVINSTAKKIWLQQQQKSRAQAEKQRQQELEALKLEQELKDQQLKAVMDSLTAKHTSNSDSEDESDGYVKETREVDRSSVESVLPFNRLEDIMREIEDERLREQQASLSATIGTGTPDSEARQDGLQHDKPPASIFWNDMLASSESLTRNNNVGKFKTVIDRSELMLQQTQQQHQAEDTLFSQSYHDDLKRVHSPKALARLLLAEVEYHEAIHDAHLQLSMMEQVQIVEQAQEETMNVANAFKEEMEKNLTSHQLALDHAILSKQFDGDLQDVMQELEAIQQTQASELAATTVSMQNELKRVSLRESTVQTDELKRMDAATNAKLYAESGTSTSPYFSDAAVQYETPEKEQVMMRQNSAVNQLQTAQSGGVSAKSMDEEASADDKAYSEEEEYEEDHFERESQSVVVQDSVKRSEKSTSEMVSSRSANEIPDEEEQESDAISSRGSNAESVLDEDDDLTEKLKQSTASSTNPYEDGEIHSDKYGEEDEERDGQSDGDGSVASSAVDETSAISGGKYASEKDDPTPQVVSASMGYEDDFDVSTTSQVHAVKKSINNGSEIAEDEGEENDEARSASIVSVDDIEDEVPDESNFKESDEVASGGSAYSSEFSGSMKEEPKSKPAPIAPAANIPERAMPIEVRMRRDATSRQVELDMFSVDLWNGGSHTDDLTRAYERDLEMRKRSDESLLLVRLQVLERKFYRDLQSIDEAIADANGVSNKQQELLLRKEATRMAFLSEKANVESLRAASMARYYQDLLAFQSLMAGADPSLTVAVPSQISRCVSAFSVTQVPICQVLAKENNENEANDVQDEYGNEFNSVSGKAEFDPDGGEVNDSDVKPQSSISSMGSDEKASEIGQADDVSANESVKSAHDDEEEDGAYDEEFASMSNSDAQSAAQKFEGENDDNVEDDGSIDGGFEKYSAKSETSSAVVSVTEDEADEHSVMSKEKEKKAERQESEGDYEDEFASISESGVPSKPSKQVDGDEEDDIIDDAIQEDAKHKGVSDDDGAASSQIHSENFEDDFEDDSEDGNGDGDIHEAASIQDEQENAGAKVESNLLYSNDFETDVPRHERDEEDESQSVSKQLDVAGTTIVVDQSGSEDSSMTRLLIEQISQLQQLTKRHNELEVKHAEEKLARKKIKVIELVQAKERLIKLEKDKFKLEEEKRQVNTLAQLAIQMDVHGELSKAKDHIKQQLEHEMATVQQTFPGFAMVPPDSRATNAEVLVTTRPVFETVQSLPPRSASTPKPLVVAGKSTIKSQEVARSIRAEVDPNDKYEVDSFGNNGYEDDAYEEDAYQSSFAEEESQFVEDNRATKTTDIVDAENEIASEADEFASVSEDGAEGSGVPNEPPVDDEAASSNDFDGEKAGDDGAAVASDDGEGSIDDYADEYEDESFDDDDAKSATSMKTHEEVDDEEQNPRDENRMKTTTTEDDEAASDGYNDDEYSEEEFERASESSEVDLKPPLGAMDDRIFENIDRVQDPPTLDCQPDQLDNVQEDQHDEVSIDQLSAALEVTISQLHQPVAEAGASATSADSADHEAHNLLVAPQIELHEDLCVLPAQLSVSISHEEEVLSKSIEEQTKRLEELKQMILTRKDEIISVQKHMRVEKRREQLTGEEKRLWDEMERTEANLRMGEAALELTRQRNQLESMHLEAKHSDYKAKTLNLDRTDLLEDFDFVEIAEITDPKVKQSANPGEIAAQSKKKTVWGATSDMVCQTDSVIVASLTEGLDLLAGYVYVEDAERVPVIAELILPAVSCITACEADELGDADSSNAYAPLVDEGALIAGKFQEIDGDECPGSNDEASLLDQDTRLGHDASVQFDSDAMDLLSGYSYVEAVEPVACVQDNLLAAFDYVEEIDSMGAHKPGDSNNGLASTKELVVDQNDQSDDDFAGEEIASESDGDECAPSPSFDAGDGEEITGRGGNSPVSKQAAEGTAQQQTSAGDAAEILRYDSDEHQDDVTGAGLDHPFHSSAHRDGVGFVHHLTDAIYGALFDDVMKDAQEMRGRLSVTLNEAQFAGRLMRESKVEGIISDSEESVDSISIEADLADRAETEPPFEAKLTKQSSSTIVQEALAESGDAARDVRVDQLTDALFKELCDQVLSAEITETLKKKQRQSNAHSANATTCEEVDDVSDAESAALVAANVATSRVESTEKANREATVSSPLAEREFVSLVVQRLEISADGVVTPAYSETKQLTALGSSRVLYEVVKDTANSIFAKHTVSSRYDGVTSDDKVDTSGIKQEVEVELERILSIRAAGSDELKRQMQSLSAGMDSDQATQEDLQVMQTQFRTSVSQVADHMRRNLIVDVTSGSTATTTAGNCTPRSHFYHPPRSTSTFRPSSSSLSRRPVMLVHSLLRYESAQLQERITNFILDDLLNENNTSSEREE